MAEITVQVCDICQDPGRAVRKYEVRTEDLSIEPMLCSAHSGPLDNLLIKLTGEAGVLVEAEPAMKRVHRRPGRSPKVTSMEEVEAKKARGRKSSARPTPA